jgi:phage portal protein BeeE
LETQAKRAEMGLSEVLNNKKNPTAKAMGFFDSTFDKLILQKNFYSSILRSSSIGFIITNRS